MNHVKYSELMHFIITRIFTRKICVINVILICLFIVASVTFLKALLELTINLFTISVPTLIGMNSSIIVDFHLFFFHYIKIYFKDFFIQKGN